MNKCLTVITCALSMFVTGCDKSPAAGKTIGIIEPIEHTAMTEIVNGFSETLKSIYAEPVTIKVMNAQGDANLKRAIIQNMRDQQYAIIIPIGVDSTQMTLSMTNQQNVLSLASDLSDQERRGMKTCHVTAVHDEISSEQVLAFIHTVYPALKHLVLIHSASDKVFPQVKETIMIGKKYGITIESKMINTLPELYNMSQSISSDAQGIFILKDSLVVSGIGTLVKAAKERGIPLITSDQGSVLDGANMALGVHEREIGVEGAKQAAEILRGKPVCGLPIVDMKNLTVFINQKSMSASGLSISDVQKAASQLKYKTEVL